MTRCSHQIENRPGGLDRDGQQRLFTAEQKAQIDQLLPLAHSIRELHEMLGMLDETEGKPCDPSHQNMNDGYIHQLYKRSQKLPKEDECWLGYFTESLLLAQDITLGEFLTMVTGQPPEDMKASFL